MNVSKSSIAYPTLTMSGFIISSLTTKAKQENFQNWIA